MGTQTRGTDFSHNGIHHRSQSHGVPTKPSDAQPRLTETKSLRLRGNASQDADEVEDADQTSQAVEPNCAAAKFGEHEPRDAGADESDARAAESDSVRGFRVDVGLFEEEGGAVAEGAAVSDLGEKGHHGDLGAAAVGALEGFEVGGAGLLVFF